MPAGFSLSATQSCRMPCTCEPHLARRFDISHAESRCSSFLRIHLVRQEKQIDLALDRTRCRNSPM